ncbi:MAG: hypothetical protein M1834_009595 [Cirrosporium novae-zelandiae]|nr:MAG: hypothetical protein M1834_009595 [Cirrosporium novae-zelandiae]
MGSFILLCFIAYFLGSYAATPAEWRSRIIYQVLTDRFGRVDNSTTAACDTDDRIYCGGSYEGIINHLDYIQNMGFTAIWISPITENFDDDTSEGEAYHGYWQQNIYELNANFGSASELKALATALHERDMYLMVDVVVNHFAWPGSESSVDYSDFYPFDSSEYFHSYCEINYDSQTSIEDCWLGDSTVELVDVNTDLTTVQSEYQTWIAELASNYSIDGLRIDTAKHVDKTFFPAFNSAAGVYCVGEVYDGDPTYTCPYQDYIDGVLNYPLYYPLIRAFESTSGSISDLVSEVNAVKSDCSDTSLLGTFSENHDVPRFASYTSDMSLAKNVVAFTLLADGVPILYEGQEQHLSGDSDPENREAIWLTDYDTSSTLYSFVASVNQIRNQAIYKASTYLTYNAYPIYSDSTTIAMRKGYDGNQIIGVFSNRGSSGSSYTLTLGSTGYTSGEVVTEILTCKNVTTDSSGNIAVSMASGLPRVFYPASQLTGSGICNS